MDQYTIGQIAALPTVSPNPHSQHAGNNTGSSQSSEVANHPQDVTSRQSYVTFGWVERFTLKHPPITDKATELMRWAWQYGHGHSKISASQLERLMPLVGLEVLHEKYIGEAYFERVHAETSGTNSYFSRSELLEEWRIKQFYSKTSTA
jgi:hypothetical protein